VSGYYGLDVPAVTVSSSAPITASLDKALADTLEKLPPSTGRGFAEATVTTTGARVEVGHRLSSSWAVSGWAGLAWGQSAEAGVRVRGSW